MVIGNFSDAIFIFVVVIINATIGTIQEYKAEKSAEDLQKMIEAKATVRRDGKEKQINAELVVPGDVVILESGKRVPADCRVINQRNLGIDESILTGESTTVQKQEDSLSEEDLETGDQANIVFAGTSVLSGRAEVLTIATGQNTQLGKISSAVTETEAELLPLIKRMNQFVKNLSFVNLGAVILLAVITFIRGTPIEEVFFMAIALAVSAIPAGLPVAMTVALAVGVNRMAKHKAIIRKLPAVEGLGSCTYIASDKTGTLTSNIQTARKLSLCIENKSQYFNVTGQGYSGEGTVKTISGETPDNFELSLIRKLSGAGVISNEGKLIKENGSWKKDGDPIDIALLALGYKTGIVPDRLRDEIEIILEITYESKRKYSAMFYKEENGLRKVAVKGAKEMVITFCTHVPGPEESVEIDKEKISESELELTANGYRVLAVASGEVKGEKNELSEKIFPD